MPAQATDLQPTLLGSRELTSESVTFLPPFAKWSNTLRTVKNILLLKRTCLHFDLILAFKSLKGFGRCWKNVCESHASHPVLLRQSDSAEGASARRRTLRRNRSAVLRCWPGGASVNSGLSLGRLLSFLHPLLLLYMSLLQLLRLLLVPLLDLLPTRLVGILPIHPLVFLVIGAPRAL